MANKKETKLEMNPLNPAMLPIPEGLDIDAMCIDILNESDKSDRYMPVAARLCWFLQNNPGHPIPVTEFVSDNNDMIIFKAQLFDENGNLKSVAHGIEDARNYKETEKHIAYQKAETQAIGRCLRNIGYGISFKDLGDEDDPIDKGKTNGELPPLNDVIENSNNNVATTVESTAKASENTTFETADKLEKAIAVLTTPYPFKIMIGNKNYKGEALWNVLSACKKFSKLDDVTGDSGQLKWGISNNISSIVNQQYNLDYPTWVNAFFELIEDKVTYKAAINKIKTELYNNET